MKLDPAIKLRIEAAVRLTSSMAEEILVYIKAKLFLDNQASAEAYVLEINHVIHTLAHIGNSGETFSVHLARALVHYIESDVATTAHDASEWYKTSEGKQAWSDYQRYKRQAAENKVNFDSFHTTSNTKS